MTQRILVVENDPMSRELALRVLKAGGYSVASADNAEAALELARSKSSKPDLVLMDMRLPGIDGLEATRRLRADPATSSIGVAALSAQAFADDVRRATEAGCDAYLTKPIGARELLDRVAEILSRKPVRSGTIRKKIRSKA
ncbi:MAG: response regulator [Actinomycetota bacterium]